MTPQQQPTQITRPSVIACASEHLHEHGFGDGKGAAGGDQLGHPPIHGAARRPVELHPGRGVGVGKDHAAPRGARSSGTELVSDPRSVAAVYRRLIDELGWQTAQRRMGIRITVGRTPTLEELQDAVTRSGLPLVGLDLR